MFLSIIVPCYNCSKYIERLLDSIIEQEEKDIEIILVDDYSTDNFQKKLKKYNKKLCIKYVLRGNEYSTHCPGNTRNDGLKYTTGDYITFLDDDDMFEPNTLKQLHDFIIDKNYPEMIWSPFREYYEENVIEEIYGRTWTHGNFYKRDWLVENYITYEKDLTSHEDLYWNVLVESTLASQGKRSVVYDNFIYKWMYEPNSLSRKDKDEVHFYIEKHLNDYIHASTDPYFELIHKDSEMCDMAFKSIITAFLYTYLYHQMALWRCGDCTFQYNYDFIEAFYYRIISNFKTSKNEIVNLVYSNPNYYDDIKKNVIGNGSNFIETTSFRDFIDRI